jgi:membrane protein
MAVADRRAMISKATLYLRGIGRVLAQAGNAWVDDHAQSMGAALSYYTVFSIAPLLLIAISVAGLVFGQDAARGAIVEQLQGLIGESGAQVIQGLLRNVAKPSEGIVATLVGAVVLVIGATSVFAELQDDLDRIWQVPTRQKVAGWWSWLRTRLLSMGLIFALGFLMLVSLAASAAFDAFAAWSTSGLGDWEPLVHAVNFLVSYVLTTALFAMIYRFMPQATIEWRDVAIGAAFTALLFSIGKFLIGLYIGKSALASGFGAAGSLAVLLAWVYYSAQIFLFGAEFTWVFAHHFGSRKDCARPPAAPAAGPQPALLPRNAA